jgi:hypothetical protein
MFDGFAPAIWLANQRTAGWATKQLINAAQAQSNLGLTGMLPFRLFALVVCTSLASASAGW